MTDETEVRDDQASDQGEGEAFALEIDGKEYRFERSPVTTEQLLGIAGIAANEGLLEVLEDGTQRKVEPGERIDLEDARKFKKRRRFRRG